MFLDLILVRSRTASRCSLLAVACCAAALALALALAPATSIAAAPVRVAGAPLAHNPLRNPKTGRPLSCPDPSVISVAHREYRYYMICTSDFARNAFPIWGSNDGVRWRRLAVVFPAGSQPGWAIQAGHDHGRYWAPDLHWIDHRWVLYFAAQMNPQTADRLSPQAQSRWALGVATTTSLRSGHWSSRLLHYSGQFNDLPQQVGHRERSGGVIDPNEFEDPITHQRYLVYAKQANEIWLGRLSADGLRLEHRVRRILRPSMSWECADRGQTCTIEGPVGYFHDGVAYILYSASSTWTGSYAVGVAASTDPLVTPFHKDPEPILSSSADLLGPGGTSEPVIGPDGGPIIYFHTLLSPDPGHISGQRYLAVGRFHYATGGRTRLTPGEHANVAATWPKISAGKPKNYTTLVRRGG